jgi:hypothetical protein
MTNVEVLVPPPQLAEHAPGAGQYPTQLIGHGCVLQWAVTANPVLNGQCFPPYCAGVVTT